MFENGSLAVQWLRMGVWGVTTDVGDMPSPEWVFPVGVTRRGVACSIRRDLRQRDELRYVADRLTTVEINGSFYALQRPRNYEAWYAETPAQFVFSVKGPRFISHMKKLHDVEIPLANFYASGVLALREKLGPILWQLPPNLGFDQSRLAQFFAMLPRTTFAAARLAKTSRGAARGSRADPR